MPEPEIARRCPTCGVSIRVTASFCPECGMALPAKSDSARHAEDTGALTTGSVTPELAADTSESAATQPLDSTGAISPFNSSAETMPLDSFAATKQLDSRDTVAPPTVLSTLPSDRKQPRQATVGMGRRAGPPPRELIDDGPNRVEKFRQMSTAVIDEATYDPSLRFVLVAAVLFVLFLLLLLLSELIT
jgi:hypothetical protein